MTQRGQPLGLGLEQDPFTRGLLPAVRSWRTTVKRDLATGFLHVLQLAQDAGAPLGVPGLHSATTVAWSATKQSDKRDDNE